MGESGVGVVDMEELKEVIETWPEVRRRLEQLIQEALYDFEGVEVQGPRWVWPEGGADKDRRLGWKVVITGKLDAPP